MTLTTILVFAFWFLVVFVALESWAWTHLGIKTTFWQWSIRANRVLLPLVFLIMICVLLACGPQLASVGGGSMMA